MTTLDPDGHGPSNYGDLPLRTDQEIKRTANKIEYTANNQDREEAQKGREAMARYVSNLY